MNKIKLYSDGADRASLLEMNESPIVKGMTTNPSLMRKAGVQDYRAFSLDVLKTIRTKPISFEVFADDISEMERQANEIKTWGPNVYVKIPVTNSEGKPTTELIRKLSQSGVKLNVTAVFTLEQSWRICQALRGGPPSILSVFAGRIADTGRDPLPIMAGALAMCRELDSKIELLWASTREAYNIIQAEQVGCDIITAPFDIIKKVGGFGKSLDEMSLDTVKTFKKDSEAAGFRL